MKEIKEAIKLGVKIGIALGTARIVYAGIKAASSLCNFVVKQLDNVEIGIKHVDDEEVDENADE